MDRSQANLGVPSHVIPSYKSKADHVKRSVERKVKSIGMQSLARYEVEGLIKKEFKIKKKLKNHSTQNMTRHDSKASLGDVNDSMD